MFAISNLNEPFPPSNEMADLKRFFFKYPTHTYVNKSYTLIISAPANTSVLGLSGRNTY